MGRGTAPSIDRIVEANAALIEDLWQHGNLDSADPKVAAWSCWACGWRGDLARGMFGIAFYPTPMKPERAHVVPVRRGGNSDPANFFLLCSDCHKAQPDALPRDQQVAWLKSVLSWEQDLWQRVRAPLQAFDERCEQHGLRTLARDTFIRWNKRGVLIPAPFLVERLTAQMPNQSRALGITIVAVMEQWLDEQIEAKAAGLLPDHTPEVVPSWDR